jgi:hypothetical protein
VVVGCDVELSEAPELGVTSAFANRNFEEVDAGAAERDLHVVHQHPILRALERPGKTVTRSKVRRFDATLPSAGQLASNRLYTRNGNGGTGAE